MFATLIFNCHTYSIILIITEYDFTVPNSIATEAEQNL